MPGAVVAGHKTVVIGICAQNHNNSTLAVDQFQAGDLQNLGRCAGPLHGDGGQQNAEDKVDDFVTHKILRYLGRVKMDK